MVYLGECPIEKNALFFTFRILKQLFHVICSCFITAFIGKDRRKNIYFILPQIRAFHVTLPKLSLTDKYCIWNYLHKDPIFKKKPNKLYKRL